MSSWEQIKGKELKEAMSEESLGEVLSKCSAIYIWKKSLDISVLSNNNKMISQLDDIFSRPNGLVGGKHLSPFLHVGEVKILPKQMSNDKRELLRNWSRDEQKRRWMINYIASLHVHTPALYVGETNNILKRTKEHMSEQTPFGKKIAQHFEDWSTVDLYYYEIQKVGKEESSLRKIIEYITNSLTIGGFTQRPG